MRRRQFIALIGGAAAMLPLAARAQQASKVPTIGYLAGGSSNTTYALVPLQAFVQRLSELGWIEGRTVAIETRFSEGSLDRAREIAAEFVRLPVDMIVTNGDAQVQVAKRATAVIPVVFPAVADPIGSDLVESLAHPGGNVTGLSLTLPETVGKRLELLREVVPGLRRVAIIGNVTNSGTVLEWNAVQPAAHTLGLDTVTSEIRGADDIAPAIGKLSGRAEALYVCIDPLLNSNAVRVNGLAQDARLPVVWSLRVLAEAGGLISYGPDYTDMFRRAAELVDKILRGTKPADIPVEQPTKFDLVVNLKTAKAFGLTIPGTLLARADEVIE
jgi:putative ABC transport system substrate-binding protein